MNIHKYKLQKAQQQSTLSPKNSFFNSFMFVDQTTHNCINLEDINHMYPKKTKSTSGIQQCMQMLKSTKKFQMQSLKIYNYQSKSSKKRQDSLTTTQQNNFTKHTVSKGLKSVKERQKKQKQQYLKDKQNLTKYLRQNMVGQQSFDQKKCYDKYAQIKYSNQESVQYYSPRSSNKETNHERGQKLIQKLQNQLNYSLRKDSEYLIPPPTKKLFLSRRSKLHERKTAPLQYQNSIQNLKFDTQKQQRIISKILPKILEKEEAYDEIQKAPQVNAQEKQIRKSYNKLMKAIKKGSYFQVEIQLSLNQKIIQMKDSRNNNLLHIAVLNNREQIFEMILDKCIDIGKEGLLNFRNKFQRTPLDLINLFGIFNKKSIKDKIKKIADKQRIQLVRQTIQFSKILGNLKR